MGNNCLQQVPKAPLNESAFVEFEEELPRFRGHFNFERQSAYNKIESAARNFCLMNLIDNASVPIVARLLAYGHHHYFSAFRSIPLELRQQFVEHLVKLDVQLMDSLYNHLILKPNRQLNPFQTIQNVSFFAPPPFLRFQQLKPQQLFSSEEYGLKLLRQRKIAVMIMLSGSQEMYEHASNALEQLPIPGLPTRLQYMLSKLYRNINQNTSANSSMESTEGSENRPITSILIQPMIITCNQVNEGKIKEYFMKNQWFGFDEKYIKIMAIKNLPILNEEGKFCLSFQKKTLMYPQGSAKCLQLLLDHSTHMRSFMKYHRIEYLHVLSCQNEHECPADPAFIGIANRFQRTILAKCTPPQQIYEKSMRYVRSQNRLHLLNIKEMEYLNDITLLKIAPVALNSIVFQVDWLLDLIDDFEIELALSKRYHPKEIQCNYYDFIKDRPVIRGRCFVFEKDIRDYICSSTKAQLIQYNRSYFSPKSL